MVVVVEFEEVLVEFEAELDVELPVALELVELDPLGDELVAVVVVFVGNVSEIEELLEGLGVDVNAK